MKIPNIFSIGLTARAFALMSVLMASCDKNQNFNLMSVEDDKKLGLQVSQEIASKPSEYPILDDKQFPGAYQKINEITNKLKTTGKLAYKDEFAWDVKIIRDDNIKNAFCTPGGYIYVYTGLIKYLNSEDQLAGVMGHEMAHADLRHTSRQLTKSYGYQFIIDAILGESSGAIAQIAIGLKTLQNSREFEREADDKSVELLSGTSYACNGTAGFFEKLIAEGNSPSTPQWLSTHPNPDNRVEAINKKADALQCSKTPISPDTYGQFKAMLP